MGKERKRLKRKGLIPNQGDGLTTGNHRSGGSGCANRGHSAREEKSARDLFYVHEKTDFKVKLKSTAKYVSALILHWLPWLLFPLTLSLRLRYVLQPMNWWVVHPDEIFQTVEVAHTDAFGYGFRPYEYLSPPSQHINNVMVSASQAQQIRLGMYSLRSLILPKLISCVLLAFEYMGIGASPYLVTKVFHAILTSLLPTIVFQFSKELCRSRNIGLLSAILVSSSLSLNIFGTHTMVNSFLSPLLFMSITPLVTLFRKLEDHQDDEAIHQIHDTNSNVTERKIDIKPKRHFQNGKAQCDITRDQCSYGKKDSVRSEDENANIICMKENIAVSICELKTTVIVNTKCLIKGKLQLKGDVYRILKSVDMYEALSGLVLAVCIYLRVDTCLIPLLLFICHYQHLCVNISKNVNVFRSYLIGTLSGILIGGYYDYVTYGRWFLSPCQWYTFNVWNNFAGNVFGINSCSFYISKLYENEPFVILSFILILSECLLHVIERNVVSVVESKNVQSHGAVNQSHGAVNQSHGAVNQGHGAVIQSHGAVNQCHGAVNQSFIVFISLLLAFSLNGHKELRFMQNAIVFMYIAVACAVFSIVGFMRRLSCYHNCCQYSIYYVYIFGMLFVSSHLHSFYNMTSSDKTKWTYAGNTDSNEVNVCLDFIRQQNDVTGVFMDQSIHMSGAYSILHHDVPIFALNTFEFMEYKTTFRSKGMDSLKNKNGYSIFSNITEFISVYNTPYLLKLLIRKTEYNFLILKTDRGFIDFGYTEVFRAGNSKVLKRTFEHEAETKMAHLAKTIAVGSNATILEYEGYWLKHYGVYTVAEHRLLIGNRIDPTRIGIFRALLDLYTILKQTTDYNGVLTACLNQYKKSYCLEPYVPIKLHSGYYGNFA